mmetsp:Transcript_9763/g.40013  ORF Transcript_9763/g.40013 Transcript_9763/m.40013 type:complete len:226 (+) Transcript_9763:522-1199(+)
MREGAPPRRTRGGAGADLGSRPARGRTRDGGGKGEKGQTTWLVHEGAEAQSDPAGYRHRQGLGERERRAAAAPARADADDAALRGTRRGRAEAEDEHSCHRVGGADIEAGVERRGGAQETLEKAGGERHGCARHCGHGSAEAGIGDFQAPKAAVGPQEWHERHVRHERHGQLSPDIALGDAVSADDGVVAVAAHAGHARAAADGVRAGVAGDAAGTQLENTLTAA